MTLRRALFSAIPRQTTKPLTHFNRKMSLSVNNESSTSPQLPESLSSISPAPKPKLHLYTAGTPNGYKASIILEELILAYPDSKDVQYDFHALSFAKNDQKSESFLKINPNGRIPALVDDNFGGHNVFETASIMLWLVEVCESALTRKALA